MGLEWGGYENGRIPESAMKVAPGFDPYPARANFAAVTSTQLSDMMHPVAWVDFCNMGVAFKSAFGVPMTFAEAYRSGAVQDIRIREHDLGGPLAAQLDWLGNHTSNHGWALSADLRNNIGTPGSPESIWMDQNQARFGFIDDVPSERWHRTHLGLVGVSGTLITAGTETIELLPEGIMEKGTLYRNKSKTITVNKKQVKNPNYGSIDLCSPIVGFKWHLPNTDYIALLKKLKLIEDTKPTDVSDGQWKLVTSQLPRYAK
jgi:hypothetical protein